MKAMQRLIATVGLVLASTAVASAVPAIVTNDLNVRAGQGTNHPVIGVMQQGSVVDVTGCGDGWCYVRDHGGYASARYLDIGSGAYAAASSARIYAPAPLYGPEVHSYYGPQVSFGIGFGAYPRHRYGGYAARA